MTPPHDMLRRKSLRHYPLSQGFRRHLSIYRRIGYVHERPAYPQHQLNVLTLRISERWGLAPKPWAYFGCRHNLEGRKRIYGRGDQQGTHGMWVAYVV